MITTWRRNAGVKTWHAERADWVRSGKAICGANMGRPWVYLVTDNAAHPELTSYQQLAHYPRRYGVTKACAHCARAIGAK